MGAKVNRFQGKQIPRRSSSSTALLRVNSERLTKRKSPRSRTSKDAIRKLHNEAKAIELRSRGCTYRQIGRVLGVSHVQAYKYVEAYMGNVREHMLEPLEMVIAIELDRLDSLTYVTFAKAMKGDLKAVNATLKVMERRAKLLGLDAPVKARVWVDPVRDQKARQHEAWIAEREREEMEIVMNNKEAREALHAYNEEVRRAKERAAAGLTTSAKH